MKKIRDKFLDAILANTVRTIINSIISLFLAIPGIGTLIRLYNVGENDFISINKYIFLVIILLIVLFALLFIWKFAPKLKLFYDYTFDYIYKNNEYTLTMKSLIQFDYTKSIQAIPMIDNLTEFTDGEYIWTGDDSIPDIKENEKFEFKKVEKIGNSQHYKVIPKYPLTKYKTASYTIVVDAYDNKHAMKTCNCIQIERPTKSIKLLLVVPSDIEIININRQCITTHGEKKIVSKTDIKPIHYGGGHIGYDVYSYNVKNPKLFMSYGIYWEWPKNKKNLEG